MRIHAAPKLAPGRIMVIEDDIAVIDGKLADLIQDDGEDGVNFDVYLHPDDVAGFIEKWCPDQMSRRRN